METGNRIALIAVLLLDLQVSPAFYAWSKHLLLRYRYSSDAAHPITLDANTMPTTSLAGISLYTPRIEEVRRGNGTLFRPNICMSGLRYLFLPQCLVASLLACLQLRFAVAIGDSVFCVCPLWKDPHYPTPKK